MFNQHLLCPQRVRRVPPQFSWIDQRLVRHDHVRRCDCAALALYLVLVTVADARGLSYYSERKLADLLALERAALRHARQRLVVAGLIAYEAPLYQVLALDTLAPAGGDR